jgi:uncharacterized protein DUF4440
MISKTVIAALGLVITFFLYGQNQSANPQQTIQKLERELETALSKGNSATLDRILAEDYIEINAQGVVRKKADVLAGARAMSAAPGGVMIGPEITVDELTTRFHGDCALVAGRTTTRYQFMNYQTSSPQAQPQGPVTVDQERFIRSYSKVDGRWQLVAWQTTSIAKR